MTTQFEPAGTSRRSEYGLRHWRRLVMIQCALGLGGAGCGASGDLDSAKGPSGAEAQTQAQTLPACSDICKMKEDCNSGCTQDDPPVATTCQLSSAGRSMCTDDPFPAPSPDEPKPPPTGSGGALQCPLADCEDNGAWQLIGQSNTRFRETIDPDRKPPETELVDYTVNMWAVPRWATKSQHVPHCVPVQCCARITHSHQRGGVAQPWGETYASTQDRCLTF
jgi:hypothetical protein